VAGWVTAPAPWRSVTTFYTRYGDVFTVLCALFFLTGIIPVKKSS